MAVLIETNVGDIVVDLFVKEKPKTCKNFIKLCKLKYYNFCLFYNVKPYFVAQTGDPTNIGQGGRSVFGICGSDDSFPKEEWPMLKHAKAGTLSMVTDPRDDSHRSQFFITLAADLTRLDAEHSPFGIVAEGLDVLLKLNDAILDENGRPLKDYRINRAIILDDPFDDPRGFRVPKRSPSPTAEQLEFFRLGAEEEENEDNALTKEEAEEKLKEQEARAQAQILELVGDLPSADIKPPDNVLFVCKLNPVTDDDDLKLIFSRFGRIASCHIVRDPKTGDSLQYAFVEFENVADCEKAYLKMENVLIDDRRIHVDFSQSVAMQKSKATWFKQYFQSKGPKNGSTRVPSKDESVRSYRSNEHRHRDRKDRSEKEKRYHLPPTNDRPNRKHAADSRHIKQNSRRRSRSGSHNSGDRHAKRRDSRELTTRNEREYRPSRRERSRSADRRSRRRSPPHDRDVKYEKGNSREKLTDYSRRR